MVACHVRAYATLLIKILLKRAMQFIDRLSRARDPLPSMDAACRVRQLALSTLAVPLDDSLSSIRLRDEASGKDSLSMLRWQKTAHKKLALWRGAAASALPIAVSDNISRRTATTRGAASNQVATAKPETLLTAHPRWPRFYQIVAYDPHPLNVAEIQMEYAHTARHMHTVAILRLRCTDPPSASRVSHMLLVPSAIIDRRWVAAERAPDFSLVFRAQRARGQVLERRAVAAPFHALHLRAERDRNIVTPVHGLT
jgi:hypothetical protein